VVEAQWDSIGSTNYLKKITEHPDGRNAAALKDSWLEDKKTDFLGFSEFGHLAPIIKWEHFQDVIPYWLKHG
jgi:hypothetical protein